MSKYKLKRCPFCGSKAEVWPDEWGGYHVVCLKEYESEETNCAIYGPTARTKEAAARLWNHRTSDKDK